MFNISLSAFDGAAVAMRLQPFNDKRLEQLHRHLFGDTALVYSQFRADDDDAAAGVVNTFAEQVLTEPSDFSFENVREGFEFAIAGPGHASAVPSVIEECVNGFLQHPFLVAQDDFGRAHLDEFGEAVVPMDEPPVQIVQIAGGEPAAI